MGTAEANLSGPAAHFEKADALGYTVFPETLDRGILPTAMSTPGIKAEPQCMRHSGAFHESAPDDLSNS
jgi:hypothetical protein